MNSWLDMLNLTIMLGAYNIKVQHDTKNMTKITVLLISIFLC